MGKGARVSIFRNSGLQVREGSAGWEAILGLSRLLVIFLGVGFLSRSSSIFPNS